MDDELGTDMVVDNIRPICLYLGSCLMAEFVSEYICLFYVLYMLAQFFAIQQAYAQLGYFKQKV